MGLPSRIARYQVPYKWDAAPNRQTAWDFLAKQAVLAEAERLAVALEAARADASAQEREWFAWARIFGIPMPDVADATGRLAWPTSHAARAKAEARARRHAAAAAAADRTPPRRR